MKFFILTLLILQMCLGSLAQAQQQFHGQNSFVCSNHSQQPIVFKKEEQTAFKICTELLKKKNQTFVNNELKVDDILPMIGGCSVGAFNTLKTQLKGYAYLVQLFVKDIPIYAYDTVKNYFSSNDNAIAAVNKVSEENISVIDKAYRLAKQYMALIKDYLTKMKGMLKNDYASFFCYPKEVQARILCELISTVFMVFYSPSNLIQNVSYVKALPKLLRMGLNLVIDTGPTIGNQSRRLKVFQD